MLDDFCSNIDDLEVILKEFGRFFVTKHLAASKKIPEENRETTKQTESVLTKTSYQIEYPFKKEILNFWDKTPK